MDIKKLRSLQKEINKKAGGGDGLFLYANKLPEELDVRLLPPPEEANGIYFVEQEGWWVNGKFYLSNSTELLGSGPDVIEEEIDLAKNSGDHTLISLAEKKGNNNIPILKKEFRYLVPMLTLDTKYDDDDQLVSCEVADARVLVAKPTLIKAINTIVTGRQYQNKTKHGIADRVKGYNIIVGKTGKGINTEYIAMGWNESMEIDEKHYDPKKVPNAWDLTRKAGKSDEYLRSVIRNYFYGEEIIEDAADTEESKDAPKKEETASKPKHSRPRSSSAGTSSRPKKEDPPAEKPGERSLLDDAADQLGDLDD